MTRPAVAATRDELDELHCGAAVVLVPTMGNLHEGHLHLVHKALQTAAAAAGGAKVCVSIYVNPLQFAPSEDFGTYPRTFDQDLAKLAGLADTVYAPAGAGLYPEPQHIVVSSPQLGAALCGRQRPGFFTGVLTVVLKLFMHTRATAAVFGRKDLQQLALVRMMVRQLALGTHIEDVPVAREADGLAMSSRNSYLDAAQRAAAPALHRELAAARDAISAGDEPCAACTAAADRMSAAGLAVDYVECRETDTLAPYAGQEKSPLPFAVFGAARLGKTRLIDNSEG